MRNASASCGFSGVHWMGTQAPVIGCFSAADGQPSEACEDELSSSSGTASSRYQSKRWPAEARAHWTNHRNQSYARVYRLSECRGTCR